MRQVRDNICWGDAFGFTAKGAGASDFRNRLVLRTDPGSSDKPGAEQDGMLTNTSGRYFAPVTFPEDGQNVCRFTLFYRDFDELDVTAELMKKPIAIGSSPFVPPVTMAYVGSSGSNSNERRATTVTINEPLVKAAQAFYYFEVDVPAGANIETVGLQIDVKPSCA